MAWILATILLIILACLLQPWVFKRKNKALNLPPGPKAFPIIGSLHLLGKFVHKDLHNLSQTYGPIMYMRLGVVPTIIVSSPHAAELFLKTHDPIFAGRPVPQTSNQLSYGGKDIVFAKYGTYWRSMRKICALQLLNTPKFNSFRSMRKEELGLLIDQLRQASTSHVVVDLSSKVSSLIADVTCQLVFGKKFIDKEFKVWIHEATQLAGAPNFGDFIPFIAMLDLQGLGRRAKSVTKMFDGFLDNIIEEHLEYSKDENKTKDGFFVDFMLDLMDSKDVLYQFDRSSFKAIILDLLIGAVDSSSTAINWALSELIKHQHLMKKMQEELKTVVGFHRMVEESDLSHLEYLEMVIKENFRMHPPIPLVPRESIEDFNINGYHIPKKSHILINEWAIGRDGNTWFDPNKFLPERFVDSHIDVKGRDFQLIPFGSGRRICPGMQLGLTLIQLIVAQLVHCFDWELPNNMLAAELDMTEEFGLTCSRAQNLIVMPIYRLNN